MKIIEITENKLKDMSNRVEDILEQCGKLMLCLEKLSYDLYDEKSSKHDDEYMHERRMNMRYREYDDDMLRDKHYPSRYR